MGFERLNRLRATFKNGFNPNSPFPGYCVFVMDIVLSYFFRVTQLGVSSETLTQLYHFLVKAKDS